MRAMMRFSVVTPVIDGDRYRPRLPSSGPAAVLRMRHLLVVAHVLILRVTAELPVVLPVAGVSVLLAVKRRHPQPHEAGSAIGKIKSLGGGRDVTAGPGDHLHVSFDDGRVGESEGGGGPACQGGDGGGVVGRGEGGGGEGGGHWQPEVLGILVTVLVRSLPRELKVGWRQGGGKRELVRVLHRQVVVKFREVTATRGGG